MAIPKTSLYDRYQLSNSSAIPLYEGSAGPEAIQVGTYLQGLYDAAQQGGNDILSMSGNVQSMAADQPLADELRNHVSSTIGKFSEAKDWENRVQEVRSLGQHYVSRATELMGPMKQYAEWKKSLDEKDLNLTPEHKAALDMMAMSGYKGLKKDALGRYQGGFKGIDPAKNLDVNKKADEWIKGYVESEGGTDITTDDGVTKYRKAGTWHVLTGEKIRTILDAARKNDNEYLSYEGQEGSIAGFLGGRGVQDIGQLDRYPAVKADVATLMNKGYDLQTATSKALDFHRRNGIVRTMEDYAVNKYAHDNRTSITSAEIGDVEKARQIKELEDKAGETIITTDTLDNPATNWSDLDKSQNEYTTARASAVQEIENAKNVTGRFYDQSHGTGAFAKLDGNGQESAIKSYYDGIKGGATLYAGLQNSRVNYQHAEDNLRKIREAKDFVSSFVANKMGTDPRLIEADTKKQIANVLKKSPDKEVRVILGGQWKTMKQSELNQLIQNSSFEKSEKSDTIMPSFLEINTTYFTTADGRKLQIQDNAVTGALDDAVSAQARYGIKRADEIKRWTKDALENYSQSTGIVKSSSRRMNENIVNTIKAGEKVIYDAAGIPLTPGSDKEKEIQALVNNGNFNYLGTYTENKGNQNSMMKISVDNTKDRDVKAAPETYRIGVNGTSNNMLAGNMIKEATDARGNIVDHTMYESALALRDGSAYNKINRSKLGTVARVKQKVLDAQGKISWQEVGVVEKGRIGGKPSITAASNGKALPINDQVSIAAWLEQYEGNPNYKVEY